MVSGRATAFRIVIEIAICAAVVLLLDWLVTGGAPSCPG